MLYIEHYDIMPNKTPFCIQFICKPIYKNFCFFLRRRTFIHPFFAAYPVGGAGAYLSIMGWRRGTPWTPLASSSQGWHIETNNHPHSPVFHITTYNCGYQDPQCQSPIQKNLCSIRCVLILQSSSGVVTMLCLVRKKNAIKDL